MELVFERDKEGMLRFTIEGARFDEKGYMIQEDFEISTLLGELGRHLEKEVWKRWLYGKPPLTNAEMQNFLKKEAPKVGFQIGGGKHKVTLPPSPSSILGDIIPRILLKGGKGR